MSTKNYVMGELALVVGGFPIAGKVSVNVTYPNDLNTVTFDTEGEATFSENSNYNWAEMEIELSQAAASNLEMSGLLLTNATIPIALKDTSGNSVHIMPEARFMKLPDASYEQEAGTRTWPVMGYDIAHTIGGN